MAQGSAESSPRSDETTPENRVATLEAEVARLRASLATRFAELAILARMIENGPVLPEDIAMQDLRHAPDARPAVPPITEGDAAARIADLTRQLERMTKRRDALLASTSWRVTAPLRWLTQGLQRRK